MVTRGHQMKCPALVITGPSECGILVTARVTAHEAGPGARGGEAGQRTASRSREAVGRPQCHLGCVSFLRFMMVGLPTPQRLLTPHPLAPPTRHHQYHCSTAPGTPRARCLPSACWASGRAVVAPQ